MRIPQCIAFKFTSARLVLFALLALFCVACTSASGQVVQQQWTTPTQEELSMTSQPEVPGAAAVYLYREQSTDDALHMQSYYFRVKVLTEAGKEQANVRLTYASDVASDDVYVSNFGFSATDITGRTIHSDGTIIPFTGKPYERTVEKTQGVKITEKVFTLPDVEVGSILEYRYKMRVPDQYYSSPFWSVQQDLFLRKGYFSWKATDDILMDQLRNEETQGIAWSSVLPPGAAVKNTPIPGESSGHTYHHFELNVHDVAPLPIEEFMPPIRSFTYRVNFYYAVDRSEEEYWKNEGKAWAKTREHFMGSNNSMADVVKTIVAPGDTDTVKLQKIYTAVMALDNTVYSRQHGSSEDRAQGLAQIKTVQDIWQRKRGSDDQLTMLFIALARSAGLKAYDMRVTDRDHSLFSPSWMTLGQLDDDVAIVVLDGKEQFFDPGQRDCPFGQMAWKHTGTGGLRETDNGGTSIASTTPTPSYILTQTQRIADLTLDTDGTVHGTVKITWMGATALPWRQQAIRRDEEAVKRSMREWVERLMPAGVKAEVTTLENLDDYEKPLTANFNVHGPLATATAKRFILPGEFFEANSKPLFPHPTRNVAIYFQHGGRIADAVRIKFPETFQVESMPKEDSFTLQKLAAYHVKPVAQDNTVLIRRTYDLGTPFFMPKEYADVRTFYGNVATDDQQPVVLIGAAAAPAAATKGGNDKSN